VVSSSWDDDDDDDDDSLARETDARRDA